MTGGFRNKYRYSGIHVSEDFFKLSGAPIEIGQRFTAADAPWHCNAE
jgi:hypothetical protein